MRLYGIARTRCGGMEPSGLTLINGEPASDLPAQDRGCMYGDGVFRTVRVVDGQPQWWRFQLAKLRRDADRLGIPSPGDEAWEDDLRKLVGAGGLAVLKLVLTRGSGQRGYLPPERVQTHRVAMLAPFPEQIERVAAGGAVLRICALRLGEQPRLAGIKHLNRLENVLARMEWDAPDIHEGLLLDAAGRVVGGVSSNLFIFVGGELLTPRLDRCGVAGMARERVMGIAGRLGLTVRETDIRLDDVLDAREVMLTNSLIRIWPVGRLEDRVWTAWPIGHALRGLLDD
ncbi:MAG TPA: aminodeoxychorismate lyase [Thiobacillaceae bacterium]|nr:aminodeoxychorismate lyase [Thiobacillaceae bacterium]